MKIYDDISVEIFLPVPLELIAPATPGADSGLKPTPRSLCGRRWLLPPGRPPATDRPLFTH
jgi:hypothetical protein